MFYQDIHFPLKQHLLGTFNTFLRQLNLFVSYEFAQCDLTEPVDTVYTRFKYFNRYYFAFVVLFNIL